MAVVVRRTFEELRDEALARMGKTDPTTNLTSRVEQVMTSAYYDLALTFHHYELHALSFPTLSSGFNTTTLPEDVFVVISVGAISNVADSTWKTLTHSDLRTLSPVGITGDSDPGAPESYARTYDSTLAVPPALSNYTLFFDVTADQDYEIQIRYYRQPTAPDFDTGTSTTSELHWLWDEYIIQHTLAVFWPAAFRFDFAQVAQQTLQGFMAIQIQAPLAVGVRDAPEKELSDVALGGQQ